MIEVNTGSLGLKTTVFSVWVSIKLNMGLINKG